MEEYKICIQRKLHTNLGTYLGKGLEGYVYELESDPSKVVKIVHFLFAEESEGAENIYTKEFRKTVRFAKKMGLLGIGPRVYEAFICKQEYVYGIYVMDKVIPFDSAFPKANTKQGFSMKDVPQSVQQGWIQLHEEMIDRGYIHTDASFTNNNLGVYKGKAIFFDFGSTKKHHFKASDKEWVLANAAFENLLEMPFDELDETNPFYRAAIAPLAKYLNKENFISLQDLRQMFPAFGSKEDAKKQVVNFKRLSKELSSSKENEKYVMNCLLSASVLHLKQRTKTKLPKPEPAYALEDD